MYDLKINQLSTRHTSAHQGDFRYILGYIGYIYFNIINDINDPGTIHSSQDRQDIPVIIVYVQHFHSRMTADPLQTPVILFPPPPPRST